MSSPPTTSDRTATAHVVDLPVDARPPALHGRHLRVVPWPDADLDAVGHDPRSTYVERYWLPVLGPSTVLLLRRFADGLDAEPDGFEVDLGEVAVWLGLGVTGKRRSPLLRTLDRTCSFDAARSLEPGHLAVRRRLPSLNARQLGHIGPVLRAEHDALPPPRPAVDDPADHDPAELRRRARSLALTMLQLGETRREVERNLHRWRFHPAMAHDALRWATEVHDGAGVA